MSYYEYDPNYDFCYYDDYPEFDVFIEEPSMEYSLTKKKKQRRKHAILTKSLEGTLSDDNVSEYYQCNSPKCLVPVVYAPTRISNSKKFLERENLHENIDVYYSDRRNIEKEAQLFRRYAQPYYYASTIQEETESSTTCIEGPLRNDNEDVLDERSIIITTNRRNKCEVPEKCHDSGHKLHKAKKKLKNAPVNNTGSSKKGKKKSESLKSDKPETSNSWTTLLSSTYTTNKDKKVADTPKKISEDGTDAVPVKKSKSCVCIQEPSKTSVKFNVKNDDSVKNVVNESAKTDFQIVRDMDQIPSECGAKNQNRKSVCNVQTMAISTNKDSSEVLSWKNKTMQQDSSTTDTLKDPKSNVMILDTSESTDITINSDEYREFLETINTPGKSENTVANQRYLNYEKPAQNVELNNKALKRKMMVNLTESSETFLENVVKAKQAEEERQYLKKRVNPLVEVPLSISSKTMYIPAYIVNDFPVARKEDGEQRAISRKKSLFIRIFRTVANLIACFQNYAYKYVLRFILFV